MTDTTELQQHAILFDLGGVLMDFGGLKRLADLTGRANDADLRTRWASSKWLQAYERGNCDSEAFGSGVVAEWDLDLTSSEFVSEFSGWPAGPFDGSLELIRSLHGKIRMGCLSNTNPAHWQQHLDRWGLVEYFEWTLVSHELGTMKPDPEVFQTTVETIGIPPEQLLFLDDGIDNVIAARTYGIRSEHTCGIDEVRSAISFHFPTLC